MEFLKYLLLFVTSLSFGQANFTVSGQFNFATNQQIVLKGFNVNQELILGKTITDNYGNFSLKYATDYVGAALLETDNGKKVIVLLNHENFRVEWADANTTASLKFLNSAENIAFDNGLHLYQNTEAKKVGINYLMPYYNNDEKKRQFFIAEMQQLENEIPNYLNALPAGSYVSYYLKIRMLLADLQLVAKRNIGLSKLEMQFKNLNFDDPRLLQSGLYYELLDTYFSVLESQLDNENDRKIRESVDIIFKTLQSKPQIKTEIAQFLFTSFEKRSLFNAAEYVAITMLNDESCQLPDKEKALFEQYRKMAVGMIASDITLTSIKNPAKHLSDLKNKYKLVVFGASWCPKCVEEIPQLKSFYPKWKKDYDLEIVFISLDTQNNEFIDFTKNFPWISSSDLKGWETPSALDYSVFATPTMYLLDVKNKIQLKPFSAEQVDAWLNVNR